MKSTPYKTYSAAKRFGGGNYPLPILDADSIHMVWVTCQQIEKAAPIPGAPTIMMVPKLGGVPHPEASLRSKLVKTPIGYILRHSTDARSAPESTTLFNRDITMQWFGNDKAAAYAKLASLASEAPEKLWQVTVID